MSSLKFSDSVSFRLIQIFQEALLLGVDGGDLLRQVRVTVDPADSTTLVLTDDYQNQVKEMHKKLEEQAKELKSARTRNSIIDTSN